MDEIGVYVDCGKVYWIINLDIDKPFFLIDPNNWKYITLLESIKDREKIILWMLILCVILILEKWTTENDLYGDILLIPNFIDILLISWPYNS